MCLRMIAMFFSPSVRARNALEPLYVQHVIYCYVYEDIEMT